MKLLLAQLNITVYNIKISAFMWY